MTKKKSYTNKIEFKIAGIPCLIGVVSYARARPNRFGESDVDYHGWEDAEWDLLDRKGYPAPWLERKLEDRGNRDCPFTAISDYYADLQQGYEY